jgi:hypothetical protein
MRFATALSGVGCSVVVLACTGGGGDVPGQSTDAGASSSSSGSGGSNDAGGGASSGGSSGELSASDFDRRCATAEDCSLIIEGPICKPCGCPNAAIAQSERSSYEAKREAAQCPITDVQCAPCPARTIACSAGTCVAN